MKRSKETGAARGKETGCVVSFAKRGTLSPSVRATTRPYEVRSHRDPFVGAGLVPAR